MILLRRLYRPATPTAATSAISAVAHIMTDSSIRRIEVLPSSKDHLPQSYTVTPPIKHWPQILNPRNLVYLISQQRNLDLALQIFNYAGNYHPGFSHTFATYLAIFRKLARAREFQEIETLIDRLQKSGIRCREDLFVVIIRNYGFANRPQDAVRTFHRLGDFRIKPTVRSFNVLLNALVGNKMYDLVKFMFNHCWSKFRVIPDVITCNVAIFALCEKRDLEGAMRVLEEMPEMGIVPNIGTYSTILGGFVLCGDVVGAKRVYGVILGKGWIIDATTYTILIDGFCKQGRLTDAVELMNDMLPNEVKPSDATYGVIIEAYCKEKKSGEALKFLDDMLGRKHVPNSATCCKIIDVLCEEGNVEGALDLWKKLLRKNCAPDNAISSTLIYWLCKNGRIREARRRFDELSKIWVPSAFIYNTIIAGLCEIGELSEAGRLWDDMTEHGHKANVLAYNMLIKGFCKSGNVREGVRVLEEMSKELCPPNKLTYSILFEGLYKSKLEGDVPKLLQMAASRGFVDGDSWGYHVKKLVGNLNVGRAVLDRILLDDDAT